MNSMTYSTIKPIRNGERGQKVPPTSFLTVTSTNVEISLKNLVLYLLPHWGKISRPYLF